MTVGDGTTTSYAKLGQGVASCFLTISTHHRTLLDQRVTVTFDGFQQVTTGVTDVFSSTPA
jgi:hypothetical protein